MGMQNHKIGTTWAFRVSEVVGLRFRIYRHLHVEIKIRKIEM